MDAKFSLGNIGITDYLIVRYRLVSAPGAEIARQVFGPVPPTKQNIVFVGLNPDFYFFDVYESVDGTALTSLFNTFEIDVASNQILSEKKYYVVNRHLTGDPSDTSLSLVDPYLDGKTIVGVTQRGIGPLRETDEWGRTSGGFDLVAPLSFSDQDTYTVDIAYAASAAPVASAGPFATEINITANTTLDSTYYNKLINCNGAGAQLVVTMDHVGSVPDGTQFYFIDQEGGAQNQTKFVPQSGEFIKWKGVNMSEIWIGKGEYLILKRKGSSWKVVEAHPNLERVGLIENAQDSPRANMLPEDNRLCLADDYPRIWWFISRMVSTMVVLDDNLDNTSPAYVRPADKPGQFIVSITKRKFRMPDTRGMSHKGLKDFTTYNTDASRLYDYPGGYQPDQVGEFSFTLNKGDGYLGHAATPLRFAPGAVPQAGDSITINTGKINTVRNTGVIFLRCI